MLEGVELDEEAEEAEEEPEEVSVETDDGGGFPEDAGGEETPDGRRDDAVGAFGVEGGVGRDREGPDGKPLT